MKVRKWMRGIICLLLVAVLIFTPAGGYLTQYGALQESGVQAATTDESEPDSGDAAESGDAAGSNEDIAADEEDFSENEVTAQVSTLTDDTDVTASGSYGSDVTWTLTSDGTLTISGTGEMKETKTGTSGVAWYSYRTSVTNVVIEEGITSITLYAFYGCTALTSVSIPSGVVSIGSKAFMNCSALEEIDIPDTVTDIGSYAFDGCGISSVTLREGLETIGIGAFFSCTNLTEISLPDSVTTLGSTAFYDCTALESIVIGSGISEITSTEVYGCTALSSIIVSSENTAYCSVDGVLFNADRTELIVYPAAKSGISYTVPDTVTTIGMYAFQDNACLETVEIPDSVTSMGDYAFKNAAALISVTIGSGISQIGTQAFYGCSALVSVDLPQSLTSIGSYAFYGCTSLAGSLTLPENLTGLGTYAFYGCSALTSVTLPDTLESVPEYAFYGCTLLESAALGEGVTQIGTYAFRECTALASVTYAESVTVLGDGVFYGCTSLTDLTLPQSLTQLGSRAFYNCSGLSGALELPEGLTEIGSYVYYGCTGITSATMSDNVITLDSYAFYGCTALESITLSENLETIGNYTFKGCTSLTDVTLPDTLTWMGAYAFGNCSSLTSMEIPNAVSSISSHLFYCCTSLKSVSLPEYYTKIGEGAFQSCTALTSSFEIPEGLTTIGDNAFYNCKKISYLSLPSTLTSIGKYAFYNCSSMDGDIVLPDGMTAVLRNAFDGCKALDSVTISDSVTSVGSYAFRYCNAKITVEGSLSYVGAYAFRGSHIYEVTIADGVTSIDTGAFYYSSLESISLPDTLTSIGSSAFYSCSGLTQIEIPEGVTSIGAYAFYQCTGLTQIDLPDGITAINTYTFYKCTALTSITIPEGVTAIGEYAFYQCTALTDVSLPTSLTTIYKYAFYMCSLESELEIPEGVTSIAQYAFYGNDLTSVTIPTSVISIGSHAFGSNDLQTVCYAGSEEEWDAIEIGTYAFYTSRSQPVIIFTGTDTDDDSDGDSDDDDEVDSGDFAFGTVKFGEYLGYENPSFAVIGSTAVLVGLFPETDDTESDFADITWMVSDSSLLSVSSVALADYDNASRYSFSVTVKAKKPGTVTITGKMSDGTKAEVTLTVVPSISVSMGSGAAEVTVSLDVADASFLESYMAGLSFAFARAYDEDTDVGYKEPESGLIKVSEYTGGTYTVADDGLSAVYTIPLSYVGSEAASGYFMVTDADGYYVTAAMSIVATRLSFSFLDEDGLALSVNNLTAVWDDENNTYSTTEFTAQVTFTYYPTSSGNSAAIDKISFSLDGVDAFKISSDSEIEPGVTLSSGESYTCTVTLSKRGLIWDKPDAGCTDTGTLSVTLSGSFPGTAYESEGTASAALTLYVTNPADEEEAEETDEEVVSSAQTAASAYEDISDKIALDQNLDYYLGDGMTDSLKVLIYTVVSIINEAHASEDDESLSEEILMAVMKKYLKVSEFAVGTEVYEIPISVVFDTEDYGNVQCDFDVVLTEFTLKDSQFAIQGYITTQLTLYLGTGKEQTKTLANGIIEDVDIDAFADAAWEVASGELKSAYKKLISKEYISLGNDWLIEQLTGYAFSEPVEEIMKVLEESGKLKGCTYKLICGTTKKIIAMCPVDLYIYDSSGTLVGSMEGDEVTCSGDNMILWTEGDSKIAILYSDTYTVEYVSTGTGTMTLEVHDQASSVGDLRVTRYEDVPLEVGVNYTQVIAEETLSVVEGYQLVSSQEETVTESYVEYPYSESIDLSYGTLTLSKTSHTYTGSALEPEVTVTLGSQDLTQEEDYTVSYANNVNVGTASVTVTGAGNYTGTLSASFQITAQTISASNVTLSYTSKTYTGSKFTPTVTVKNAAGTELTKDKDYTLSTPSGRTNAGTYTYTVTGTGNYKGTGKKTLTIKAVSIKTTSSAYVSCKLSETSYTYSGSAKKPGVTLKVKVNGSTKKISKSSSSGYTVSYKNNTKIGKATVTITGTGNYTGTITKTFKIYPKKVTIKSSTKSSAKKKITVKWGKVSGSVSYYQIRYRKKGTSKWTTKTVKATSASTQSKTLTSLTSGKSYEIQVRAYKMVSGTKYYGSWSSKKTVKVK